MPFNGTVDEEEFCELPPLLAGREVLPFLQQFGFLANTPLDWQKGPFPELRLSVASHSSSGRHVFYNVECTLWRASQTGGYSFPKEDLASQACQPWLVWRASRRLAHLRQGLHDLVKQHLGSSYKTYFCRVPFAQRFRPAGTTERLDNWCRRLAYCLSSRLVPPIVAANVLRVLGAPNLKDSELPGVDFFQVDSMSPTEIPEEGAESLTTRSYPSEGVQALSSPSATPEAAVQHSAQVPVPRCVDILLPGLEDGDDSDGDRVEAQSTGSSA
ncbi:ABCG24 [Symbiodinium pilosum]|uniref:ABCG24 protein n=1 Tax=Symbiodinium pilosum TaxID=2952 RepID=A0A812M9D9_SYMPI|nr:ABCG24 [Symbiodinium pilosum]